MGKAALKSSVRTSTKTTPSKWHVWPDFCFELVDGKVQLKESHQYYTQLQRQIFVKTVITEIFVFVWTLKDRFVLRIVPNPEFCYLPEVTIHQKRLERNSE